MKIPSPSAKTILLSQIMTYFYRANLMIQKTFLLSQIITYFYITNLMIHKTLLLSRIVIYFCRANLMIQIDPLCFDVANFDHHFKSLIKEQNKITRRGTPFLEQNCNIMHN